jgi:hypothetical protein
MKNYQILIIGIVLGIFISKSCQKNQKIIIPEKKGKLVSKIIKHETITNFKEVPKFLKNTEIESELKLKIKDHESLLVKYNDDINVILEEFLKSDSLLKLEKFKNQISLKKFETITEDDDIVIRTVGLVSGEVKELDNFYRIKKQAILKNLIKEKSFSLNAGFGSDFSATNPVLKFGLGYKNYKIDFYKINNQNLTTISYEIKF